MRQRFLQGFVIIAMLFFLSLLVFFFVQLSTHRSLNLKVARDTLQSQLNESAGADLPGGFISSLNIGETTRLRAMAVYSPTGGISELWAINDEYLANLPEHIALVRGEPNLVYNDIIEEILFHELSQNKVKSVYNVLNSNDIFQLLIPVLYMLLGFAVFTLMYLCVACIITRPQGEKDPVDYKSRYDDEEMASRHSPEFDEEILPASTAVGEKGENALSQRPGTADEEPASWQTKTRTRREPVFKPDENQIWPVELLKMRLNNEIERSAENESDIGFAVFRLGKSFRKEEELINEFESALLNNFRYQDLIFHLESQHYGIILPGRNQRDCLKQIGNFQKICRRKQLPDDIFAGFSTRSGRLMDGTRLLKESLKAASMANNKKSSIISFKTDAKKYRAHLMETL